MVESHGILLFYFNVSIAYRGGEMGSRVEWEVAKTTSWGILGAAMMPIGTHAMAHALLVGHKAVGAILGPHHPFGTLHWCHCSSCDFGGLAKCPPEKQTS